jgi:hypothetical protein
MSGDAALLVDSYLNWIRKDVATVSLSDTITELTTPFVDRHNDHLQVYAERKAADVFLLTDDGYILSELRSSGVEARGSKREEIVRSLLVGHGVSLNGRELQIEASIENLGKKVHSLIQAMLSLDDMFVLAQPATSTVFLHQVEKFFDEKDVRYTPSAKFAGKSGLDHLVNFVIPKSRQAPERFVQVVNTPRRDRVENFLFAVNDTKLARQGNVEFYAVINDVRLEVAPEIVHAFETYGVNAAPWSRRDEMVEALTV